MSTAIADAQVKALLEQLNNQAKQFGHKITKIRPPKKGVGDGIPDIGVFYHPRKGFSIKLDGEYSTEDKGFLTKNKAQIKALIKMGLIKLSE